ncbi:MAG: hypothetical protein OXG97_13760 [Candidatus Poribacteria bacterium]|nr:hypothetical protein [Candidatus Poribacteria bacterium]
MVNVLLAFKIIIRHLSGRSFEKSRRDIHRNYVLSVCLGLDFSPFERAFRYSQHFGFVKKRGNRDWHIKSVEKMCNRLCDLDDDPYIGVRELNHPISLAFGIIIHHFNGQIVPTTEIETRVETEIENYQGELSQYENENVVPHTLRFLNHFGFAKELEDGDWRIKSVDDMCARLRGLADNRNIGDEGEDF